MASKTETPEQYRERFARYGAGKDPIQMQEEAPRIISRLIEGAADETLKRRPAPGKWSVTEIIAHLADDEIATSWRYRQMIEHNGERILGFDQDEWRDWAITVHGVQKRRWSFSGGFGKRTCECSRICRRKNGSAKAIIPNAGE